MKKTKFILFSLLTIAILLTGCVTPTEEEEPEKITCWRCNGEVAESIEFEGTECPQSYPYNTEPDCSPPPNQPPTADFTYSPNPFYTMNPATFTSTSEDPDGYITKYEWSARLNQGDPMNWQEGSETFSHTFELWGEVNGIPMEKWTCHIALRVTDDDGEVVTEDKILEIFNTCGNGVCESYPWPYENCMSCDGDCSPCNSYISDYTIEFGEHIVEVSPNYPLKITYYSDSLGAWSDWHLWEDDNHIEVFKNNNNIRAKVRMEEGGYTLRGYCTLLSPSGAEIELPLLDEDWQDIGRVIPWNPNTEDRNYHGWCKGYWRTNWREDHVLTEDGAYTAYIFMWGE